MTVKKMLIEAALPCGAIADLGETALRGFEDPFKLWEVRWKG